MSIKNRIVGLRFFPASPASHSLPRVRSSANPSLSALTFAAAATSRRVRLKSPRTSACSRPSADKQARPRRHQHVADAHVARDVGRMQRPRAAERDQREVARVHALLDRNHPHRAHHVDVDDFDDAGRRAHQIDFELGHELVFEHFARALGVHRHAPAEQRLRIQAAQHDVRVGYRRLGAAAPIRGRSRHRACALRADFQQPARVDPRDAAAACAYGVNVDACACAPGSRPFRANLFSRARRRESEHTSVDVPPMSNVIRLPMPSSRAKTYAADDAAGGTREERVDGQPAHRTRRHRAAVRLHDARRNLDAEIGDAALEALEIAIHDRHQARVDRGRRKALELAEFRQHVGRRAKVDLGPQLVSRGCARGARGAGFAYECSIQTAMASTFLSRSTATALRTAFSSSGVTSAAVRRDALGDFQPAVAQRRRRRLQDIEIEVMRPPLARELDARREIRRS